MADLLITLSDQYTPKANSIATANKGLSKSMEEIDKKTKKYSKTLNDLNKSLATQQTELRKSF